MNFSKSILLILLCINSSSVFPQAKSNSIALGPEFVIPTGVPNVKAGLGAAFTGVFGLSHSGNMTLNISYAPFKSKYSKAVYSFVPLKIGYQTRFNNDKLYLHGETGVALLREDFNHRSQFIISGGLGYLINIGNGYLDIGSRFNYVNNNGSNFNWIGIRAAYGYKLSGKSK